MTAGYGASRASHVREWTSTFPITSVDDFSFPQNGSLPNATYIIEAAITAVTNPFHLLQNTITQNAMNAVNNATINSHSIMVGGLGSDSYAGQIFWDAEIWMQPGLVITFPFATKAIAEYRVARYAQAKANVKTAYQSSKNKTSFSPDSAVFPWTSGRAGNCTATGPCFDYEYHINGDIAQEFANYWTTSGDTAYFRSSLLPIYDSIATFYSDILTKNGTHWSLTNMTDPDEYANHIDNGGFTMPLIADTLSNANTLRGMFNQSQNSTWTTQSQNVLIPHDEDSDIRLEYTGMNGSVSVKQADVVLVTYPLSSVSQNYTASDSLSDLDYYAAKQSVNGPGMTYSVFSIIANQVSPSGCASYTYQQYSEHPYARAPWFQFSEQLTDNFDANGGTHPAYPFLTGHGGANQIVPFGYLGLRLIPTSAALHINPALPPQIPSIRYRTIHWRGWPILATSNQTHTTLSRPSSLSPASGAVPNSTYSRLPIPISVGPIGGDQTSFDLSLNSTITIPNRQPGLNATTPGNIAQCLPVTSSDAYLPGQFPIAAIDGAASTKWQPQLANQTASITVSLPPGHRVTSLRFDWGQAPPWNYSVVFHNSTSSTASSATSQTVHADPKVAVSAAYNATEILSIVPVQANVTTFDLTAADQVYTASYATLSIWGSQLSAGANATHMSGDGATVAEWDVIVADDDDGTGSTRKRSVGLGLGIDGGDGDGVFERELLGRAARYEKTRSRSRSRRAGGGEW